MQRFLADVTADGVASSPFALVAKAAALYDRASYMASQLDGSQLSRLVFPHRRLTGPAAPATDTAGFEAALLALDSSVEQFTQSLPSVERAGTLNEEQTHSLLIIHGLCHCATIQLHRAFIERSSTSKSRCLASANVLVRVVHELTRRLKVVSPLVGVSLA